MENEKIEFFPSTRLFEVSQLFSIYSIQNDGKYNTITSKEIQKILRN